MKKLKTLNGFTLIELLVVIGIIALLASIALPAFSSVQVKAQQTKALNNAKQIGFACKAFATDNNGQYPTYAYSSGSQVTTTQVATSNAAFGILIPTYLSTLQCFYQPGSPETPGSKAPPDPSFATVSGTSGYAIPTALNHWAYVTGMSDTSNSSFPLITDNPANTTSPVKWATTGQGSVWKGKQTIVVHVDDSAAVDTLTSLEDLNGPAGADLFETPADGSWMSPVTTTGGSAQGNALVPTD
jgi:prepilin-type N-terminal cleavage/methylation domain-containing protein